MRELNFVRSGQLEWRDRPDPVLENGTDALVRPFVASRCDGDTLPIHRSVSRGMQAGLRLGLIDPVVAAITGDVPFRGPFGIGHESIAEVTEVGPEVRDLNVGDVVVVPWALSCGSCRECRLRLTAKCSTMREESPGRALAAFGFGPASGPWGGMVADSLRIPHAEHMLVRVPEGVDPLRIAAASDNLTDAWRSVVPPLRERPGGRVLVLGGGGQSIGLYAAGLAVEHGAEVVDYVDTRDARLEVAEALGARVHKLAKGARAPFPVQANHFDVAVEASSTSRGLRRALRALRPGGICTGTGYYLSPGTKLPVMDMYATSATLRVGVSHVRPVLPDLLDFVATSGFPAEKVTSLLADWEDAPEAYAAYTTKLVLHRARITG
ncbi:dehydrogenase [Knoellia sinensis KCTC 19936]|uniref:Dehydrogenase n=1 Tax=Knoellia sinensis KCTC 19936 TaxID=1385520 RepID=A0A0A0JE01_9MICO|nr:alcohol dehydrogenase catalytic domain-containing protein [Knoellia sinensis]KGN34292.1 dehydrogenase [Knoellia sinensis KCTC 19936]